MADLKGVEELDVPAPEVAEDVPSEDLPSEEMKAQDPEARPPRTLIITMNDQGEWNLNYFGISKLETPTLLRLIARVVEREVTGV